LDRRLGGLQSWSGRSGEEKNAPAPPGLEPKKPDQTACSLVAILTELSWPKKDEKSAFGNCMYFVLKYRFSFLLLYSLSHILHT
jgi:hypothetical protein